MTKMIFPFLGQSPSQLRPSRSSAARSHRFPPLSSQFLRKIQLSCSVPSPRAFAAFVLFCLFRVLGAVVPPSLALSPSPPTDSTVCAVMNQSLNDEHDFTLTSQWRSHGSTMPCLQTAHRPRSLLSFAVFSASRRPAGPARGIAADRFRIRLRVVPQKAA